MLNKQDIEKSQALVFKILRLANLVIERPTLFFFLFLKVVEDRKGTDGYTAVLTGTCNTFP